MTTDALIADLIAREGGYSDRASDRGGPTNMGITATTLGEWRRLGRQATRAEVQALQPAEAGAIYRARYLQPFAAIPFDELRAQLVDFGVNSGTLAAVRTLQEVLKVPVDGIVGPRTTTALATHDWRLVNAALVGARVRFLEADVDNDPTQLENLHGWVRRAVSFYVT